MLCANRNISGLHKVNSKQALPYVEDVAEHVDGVIDLEVLM